MTKTVRWTFYIDETQDSRFGIILGSDAMEALGIDLQYSLQCIVWGDAVAPMRNIDDFDVRQNNYHLQQDDDSEAGEAAKQTTKRATAILDAKYEKADLDKIVANITTLNSKQKQRLRNLLQKYESLFDGTLGDFDCEPADIDLKPGQDEPYHAKSAFVVPRIHRDTLFKEIQRLVCLGVLRRNDKSRHAYPTFIIPKKNGTVRFVSDFRKQIKQPHTTTAMSSADYSGHTTES